MYGTPAIPIAGPPVPGGQRAGWNVPTFVVREFEQPLWSTFYYADATALVNRTDRVFAITRGANGQGFPAGTFLSLPETNMEAAGQLPGGLAYDVHAIALQPHYVDNAAFTSAGMVCAQDLNNILHHLVPAWFFLQTSIDIAPAILIGAGGGIFGATADTGAVEGTLGSRIALNNGGGAVWMYRLFPILLPSKVAFGIDYKWGARAAAVDGGLNNNALLIRAVLLGRAHTAIGQG